MDKAARFCQSYRFLTPTIIHTFAVKLLDSITPFLWEIEKKKDQPCKLRFRVTSQRVDKTFQFLFRFFN